MKLTAVIHFKSFFYTLFAFVCLGSFSGKTQTNYSLINNLEIETKILYGSVLPHYSFMNYIIDEYQKGFEIQCKTKTYGRSPYDYWYRFPSYGLGYQNMSIGNKEKLGRTSMFFALLDVPIIEKNSFSFRYQGNFGIAFAHKPLSKSVYNTPLSSPFNFYIGLDAIAEYIINPKGKIRTSIELSHISNGKISTPNLGFNSCQVSASYIHQIQPIRYTPIINSAPDFSSKHNVYMGFSGGYKSDDFLTDKKYPTSSFILEYEYQFVPKYGIGFGTDFFYDQSLNALKPELRTLQEHTNLIESGIHVGAFTHYSHMSFFIQCGKYTVRKSEKPPFYSRVGIRYQFKHLYVNFSLKSHKTTSNFLEIGCGYRFQLK